MSRKTFSEGKVLAILISQGAIIPCGKCRKAMTDPKNIMREHLHQIAGGGEDEVSNCQYWHKKPCSHEKTYGTKATTAGSDVHARTKSRRILKAQRESLDRQAEHARISAMAGVDQSGAIIPEPAGGGIERNKPVGWHTVTPRFKQPKQEKRKWKR